MVESNLSGSDDEIDLEYEMLEKQAEAELEKVKKELRQLPEIDHALFLRSKVSDCEEEYLALSRELKQLKSKITQAKGLKMDGKIIEQLEEAFGSKETQVEVKEQKLERLNGLL
jgi:multidrug resistance efflux pump